MAFALENYQNEEEGQLGDWSDVWDGVKDAASWIYNQTKAVQQGSRVAQNVANNAQNITAWRVDGNTVVIGAAALLAIYLLTNRRR